MKKTMQLGRIPPAGNCDRKRLLLSSDIGLAGTDRRLDPVYSQN